jgi:hypothetical protein
VNKRLRRFHEIKGAAVPIAKYLPRIRRTTSLSMPNPKPNNDDDRMENDDFLYTPVSTAGAAH